MNTPEVPSQPAYQPGQNLVETPKLKPNPQIPMDSTIIDTPVTPRTEPMMDPKVATTVDPDVGYVARVPGPSNQLPIGTLMKVRLADNISTESTPAGMKFTAQLIEGVERDGHVLLPVGSTVSGYVTDIHGGKRVSGAASIHLKTSMVTLPDGTKYAVRGQVIDTDMFSVVRVDREGTIYRRDHKAKTTGVLALTTGSGAAAGAMLGGVPGALIGAGVGAGVSTVVWLKQDRQAELPAETKIVFSLTEPLTVGTM
jgi:hypothetical protein